MLIFNELDSSHSKENSNNIIAYIANDEQKFKELMDCFYIKSQNYRVPQRAAHVVSRISEKNPELVRPYIKDMIERLFDENLKNSLKRNILRILQFHEFPHNSMGKLYDLTYSWLTNPKEEIAIRAFCMTILYKISIVNPELKMELKSTIEYILEKDNISPGIRSRAKIIYSKLVKDLIG